MNDFALAEHGPTMSPPTTATPPNELRDHFVRTYSTLRWGLIAVGLLLPVALWLGGMFFANQPLANSMSAYYYAGDGVMRDWFVGSLVAIGVLLIAYQGFSILENYALDFAGLFAAGVAIFPMTEEGRGVRTSEHSQFFSIHGTCAVLFFLCIAYVCVFQSDATLRLVEDPVKRMRYLRTYQGLGLAMALVPLGIFAASFLTPLRTSVVFFVEAGCAYVFAAYWAVKGWEIRRTDADRLAAEGALSKAGPTKVSDLFHAQPVVQREDARSPK